MSISNCGDRLRVARAPSLKHADGGSFDLAPQGLMQAIARHDVGVAAEDVGGKGLHLHQIKQAELAFFVIEKQINV